MHSHNAFFSRIYHENFKICKEMVPWTEILVEFGPFVENWFVPLSDHSVILICIAVTDYVYLGIVWILHLVA